MQKDIKITGTYFRIETVIAPEINEGKTRISFRVNALDRCEDCGTWNGGVTLSEAGFKNLCDEMAEAYSQLGEPGKMV